MAHAKDLCHQALFDLFSSANSSDALEDEYVVEYLCSAAQDFLSQGTVDVQSYEFDEIFGTISSYITDEAALSPNNLLTWFEKLKNRMSDEEPIERPTNPAKEHSVEPETEVIAEKDNTCYTEQHEEKLTTEEEQLVELFPHLSVHQVKTAICSTKGNIEDAVDLLLNTKPASEKQSAVEPPKRATATKEDMSKLRNSIVARYGVVALDSAESEGQIKIHKPVVRYNEEKKLLRYREGQVVSTKGERFSVVKDPQEDSEAMKKTFVNLKPAKKYRF
eukprot:Colp12_sorted_trinity150504_noHs@13821